MSRVGTIARRTFLIGSAAIVGGVAFGAYVVTRPHANPLLDGLGEGEVAITPFVKITPQGITLIVPRADIGQGIASMQAHFIAEELDIDPHTAQLDPGPPSPAYYNATLLADSAPYPLFEHGLVAETNRAFMAQLAKFLGAQFTGGSSSTADMHETLRRAGATARETLKQAAANRTGLARHDLKTDNGAVVLPDGKRLAYTGLAGESAEISPVTDVDLRTPDQWRYLGKPFRRTDIVAKSTGRQSYGIDVRLEGMLYAAVRRNPGIGGGVKGFDATAAKAMRGVHSVVPVTGGVGVLADNTWRAFQAADAINIDWAAPNYPATSEEIWKVLEASQTEARRNTRMRDDGDVEAGLAGGNVVAAEYRVPFLAHAALEPLSATVLVEDGKVQVWTASQIPLVLRDRVVSAAGVEASKVVVHVLPAGGSFGRRLDADYVVPAVELARTVPGTPVKMTLSREEDMAQDYPRPAHMARCRGAVSDGKVATMVLDSISQSLGRSWFGRILGPQGEADPMIVWGAYDQPYAIPNYQVTGYEAPPMVPIGSWRSPGACSNSFFHESFLSELIHAAGADPLAERLRLIKHDDSRRVLEAVGEMSNWTGAKLGPGRGRGIAFAYTHGVPVAEVVDVTITEQGVRIDEVWIAADCGTVFDPVNAEAQLTSGAIWGLGHAMNCERTYENHAPVQTNFDTFEGMRLHQTPEFHTRLLGKAERVRGLGEPATAPAAPALADAIFAATGKRIRELPFNRSIEFV